MDFTAFLFGNINEEGELENEDLLGRNEVAQLGRLDVVNDVMDDVRGDPSLKELEEDNEEEEEEEEREEGERVTGEVGQSSVNSEDYGDITELAEDDTQQRHYDIGMNYVQNITKSHDQDDDYDEEESEEAPPIPPPTQLIKPTMTESTDVGGVEIVPTPPTQIMTQEPMEVATPTETRTEREEEKGEEEKKEFPLLPDNMTKEELWAKVKTLFPTFKPNSILRFSTLIPPKPSSLPNVWKDCVKPNRRPPHQRPHPEDWTFKYGPIPDKEFWDDQTERFLTPVGDIREERGEKGGGGERGVVSDTESREWRQGPAKIWYDQLNVPEEGYSNQLVDYGYKIKSSSQAVVTDDEGYPSNNEEEEALPDDAFLMVTQLPWENDILYYIPAATGPPKSAQGGVWTTVDVKQGGGAQVGGDNNAVDLPVSMFPVQNTELIYDNWEDDIIIDSEDVKRFPRPMLARLDPNDPNMIIGIPKEPSPLPTDITNSNSLSSGKKDNKKSSKSFKQSNKSDSSSSSLSFANKDQFNLSNDEFYNPSHASSSHGLPGIDSSNIVQHSTPSLDLYVPWFPTHWSAIALRYFHRPRLKFKAPIGDLSTGWQTFNNLKKNISKKDKEREKERVASGGGEVFFMRTPEDLSSCDSHVILAEYSEEHPPLVMGIGMATRIKNYYRRPEKIKGGPPEFTYGETTFIQNTSYFLGSLKPGQSLQSFECNLFRAPVYIHEVPSTDFLAIRADNKYYIREVKELFVVGQECPKVEVPAPNSKTVNQFQKDFLQVYLFRLFQDSDDNPKKIKMENVRRAFPQSVMSESVIRKVLKQFADFKREGYDSGSWVLRSDVRLPTEEEIRAMVTPEQACAFFSMLAAEQRLKDAGYGGKSLFAVEEEEEGEESSQKIDDEVRAAPWNTTRHFINAMKGKYQLSVSGPADPTGCGEGFSYTRLNPKDTGQPSISPSKRPKSVMGTDADLRKLKLNKARNVLRNFGVPEEEINKLSRWKVIDLVRSISTEAARSGGAVDINSLMFARGTRFSQMEAQERYKDECQRVFDIQNRVLSSNEILSTDEESSDSDSDDELGRNLESLLSSKKTALDLTHEQEEMERQELRRLLMEDQPASTKTSDTHSGGADRSERATPSLDIDDTSSVLSFSSMSGRRLLISRTFRDEGGREYVRHEVVKNQGVIDAYVSIMSRSKDKDIRMEFAEKDEKTREDMRKEVKRLQSALRQLDRAQERAKQKPQKPKKKEFTAMHLTCSACGQKGHMKTNKHCPKYKNQPVQVAPTDAELVQSDTPLTQDDLVKVEGTKVVLKKDLLEHAEDVRRRSLVLKFPKEKFRKRKRQGDEPLDYLEKKAKAGKRRHTNPEVPFAAALEKVVNKLSAVTEFWPFAKPVSSKDVPDYYNLIKFPMDLQSMKDNIRKHKYETREQFMEAINLIVNNCITYNGFNSELTKTAQRMSEMANNEIKQNSAALEKLEHAINPLLGDDPQAAISFLCRKCIERMKNVPNSWPFHFPVSSKKLPDYRMIITKPMDLQTMKKKCEVDTYRTRDEFLIDLNQIVDNSITYNGPTSPFTQTAQLMRDTGLAYIEQEKERFTNYEGQLGPRVSPPVGGYSISGDEEESVIGQMEESMDSSVIDGGTQSSSGQYSSQYSVGSQQQYSGGDIVDVEGYEDSVDMTLLPVPGGIDLLSQDLQYSSSSSSSSNEEEDEI